MPAIENDLDPAHVIDQDVFARTQADLGAETTAHVVHVFLDDMRDRLSQSRNAGNLNLVRANAHTLRGNCLLFGALPLADDLSRVEETAARADLPAVIDLLAKLQPLVEATERRLIDLVAG